MADISNQVLARADGRQKPDAGRDPVEEIGEMKFLVRRMDAVVG
jgi:hypothetical protein